jgi:hypothetical protein
METIGAQDMSHLSQHQAQRFHTAAEKMRSLVDELMQVIPGPRERGASN